MKCSAVERLFLPRAESAEIAWVEKGAFKVINGVDRRVRPSAPSSSVVRYLGLRNG